MMATSDVEFDPNSLGFGEETAADTLEPLIQRKYACTVVSLMPVAITESKPHMLPSTFVIPAAKKGDIAILYVEEGVHFVPNPFDNNNLRQITPAKEMARSIVDDYSSAHICLDEGCKPGLFWVEGRLTKAEIKKHYSRKINEAAEMQNHWFHALCSMADADFQRNKNMMAVSDLQREAAKYLGVQKDWVEFQMHETTPCPFCKFSIAPGSIKCINCKEVIDQKEYDKLVGKKS